MNSEHINVEFVVKFMFTAPATTGPMESVALSLEELSVTPTLSTGAALSMDSVEAPRYW